MSVKELKPVLSVRRLGFTLVEVMMAATIMVMIIGGVLFAVGRLIQTWDRTTGKVEGYFEGDALADFMQQDLQSMIIKRDGKAWLQVSYPTEVGQLTGSSVGGLPLRPPQIMFFSSTYVRPRFDSQAMMNKAADRKPIPGSICAVKYQLSYKSPFQEGSATEGANAKQENAFYGLYRGVLDSRTTFDEVLGEQQGDERNNEYALERFWGGAATVLGDNGAYIRGVDLKSWMVSPENFLSPNVVDIQVTFAIMYKEEGRIIRPGESAYSVAYIPPGTPFTVSDKIYVQGNLYQRTEGGGLMTISPKEVELGILSHAEVSVTFISEAGAKELRNLQGSDKNLEAFQRLRQQHGTTTSRKINFLAQPVE